MVVPVRLSKILVLKGAEIEGYLWRRHMWETLRTGHSVAKLQDYGQFEELFNRNDWRCKYVRTLSIDLLISTPYL